MSPVFTPPPPPSRHKLSDESPYNRRQITFSQIDNTVLGALPVDIRREVVSQLEARQRQREAMNSSNIGGGDHTVDNDAVIASLLSTAGENDGDYSPPKDSASGSGGGEGGAGTAPLPAPPAAAADFVVREGLDVNVGDSFGKAQQVISVVQNKQSSPPIIWVSVPYCLWKDVEACRRRFVMMSYMFASCAEA